MRVVYFLQTYKNLPHIQRLVGRIKEERPDACVVISQNASVLRIDPALFAGLSDVHVTHVEQVQRASFSLVQPYLDLVDWLLRRGATFDWVVNLSGQCYPARSLFALEEKLACDDADGYCSYFDAFVPSPENPWPLREARHRYLYHYQVLWNDLAAWPRRLLSLPRRVVNNLQPFVRLDTSYGLRLGRRASPVIFGEAFRCYGGSYFMALSRRCVEYLARFLREHADVVDYFRRVLMPDETFLHTALANNPELRLRNENLFYINWRGGRLGSPRVLGAEDYPAIVASGAYFARKFDGTHDDQILDLLDQRARAEQGATVFGA
jgi:hypothetical protein